MFYNITGFDNYEVDPYNCIIRNKITKLELKWTITGGYPRLSLFNNFGKRKNIYCHRLFMELLSGNGNEVNHKDGNKLNWRIDNLELVTRRQNLLHCSRVLKRGVPFNHAGSKEVYVINIHTKEKILFPSTNEVARFLVEQYGIKFRDAESYVYRIIKGYRKVKIYRDYTFYRKHVKLDLNEFVPYTEDYLVSKKGEIYSKKVNRLLKFSIDGAGYECVKLYNKSIKVHRVVAEVFLPNPNNLPVVDHIDRNKSNNNVNNLRWVTYADNILNSNIKTYSGIDIHRTTPVIGFDKNGIKHVFERITDVRDIGINRHMVRKYIRSGKEYKGLFWKEISKEEYINLKEK